MLSVAPPSVPPLKGIVVVYYKYETITLGGLLAEVGKSPQGGTSFEHCPSHARPHRLLQDQQKEGGQGQGSRGWGQKVGARGRSL